jgi:hypothetical protein
MVSPALGDHRAQPPRGLEQLGSLVTDDAQVIFFADIRVMAIHQLQHFALGDHVGGIGEYLHDMHVMDRDHHLEGARVEEVADQDAGGIAEQGVGRVTAATQGRFIDDIVVQQSGGVDELDCRRQFVMPRPGITQCLGAKDH